MTNINNRVRSFIIFIWVFVFLFFWPPGLTNQEEWIKVSYHITYFSSYFPLPVSVSWMTVVCCCHESPSLPHLKLSPLNLTRLTLKMWSYFFVRVFPGSFCFSHQPCLGASSLRPLPSSFFMTSQGQGRSCCHPHIPSP